MLIENNRYFKLNFVFHTILTKKSPNSRNCLVIVLHIQRCIISCRCPFKYNLSTGFRSDCKELDVRRRRESRNASSKCHPHFTFFRFLRAFCLVISDYEANNSNNSHGTGIFHKIVSELLYRENTEGMFLHLKHINEVSS